jgi:hypothetical protein
MAESQNTKCQEMQLRHGLTAKSTWVLELQFTVCRKVIILVFYFRVLKNKQERERVMQRNVISGCFYLDSTFTVNKKFF